MQPSPAAARMPPVSVDSHEIDLSGTTGPPPGARAGTGPSAIPHHEPSEVGFESQAGSVDVSSSSPTLTSPHPHFTSPLVVSHLSNSPPPLQVYITSSASPHIKAKRHYFKRPSFIAYRFNEHQHVCQNSIASSENARNDAKDGDESNSIIQVLREEQLGRNIFLLSIPIASGFVTYYNPTAILLHGRLVMLVVTIGATSIWIGLLLRKVWPKVATTLELLGVGFMLVALFGYLALHLPGNFLWLPVLCLVLSLVPLGVAFFRREKPPEIGADVPAAFGIA
ncbi:hypothetical protein TIFTF001_008134 [Ficus carica]|uniref:Uncharacterized protein n=1 Tax=Ficus carica TaxID=3494 RepID=A0AA87ZSJ2_FICCA|nr:hypothetical protein TIFTF001_008134 [Ficus carica]